VRGRVCQLSDSKRREAGKLQVSVDISSLADVIAPAENAQKPSAADAIATFALYILVQKKTAHAP